MRAGVRVCLVLGGPAGAAPSDVLVASGDELEHLSAGTSRQGSHQTVGGVQLRRAPVHAGRAYPALLSLGRRFQRAPPIRLAALLVGLRFGRPADE